VQYRLKMRLKNVLLLQMPKQAALSIGVGGGFEVIIFRRIKCSRQ
jgi:hypothetical protein